MKAAAAALALLSVVVTRTMALTDEQKEMLAMLHNNCRDQVGVAEEDIQKAQKGEFDEGNEKVQCYMKCLFVQYGAMSEDGTFDAETAISVMPPEMADKMAPIVHACKNTDGPNPCMKAMKINQCFKNTAPDLYMLP